MSSENPKHEEQQFLVSERMAGTTDMIRNQDEYQARLLAGKLVKQYLNFDGPQSYGKRLSALLQVLGLQPSVWRAIASKNISTTGSHLRFSDDKGLLTIVSFLADNDLPYHNKKIYEASVKRQLKQFFEEILGDSNAHNYLVKSGVLQPCRILEPLISPLMQIYAFDFYGHPATVDYAEYAREIRSLIAFYKKSDYEPSYMPFGMSSSQEERRDDQIAIESVLEIRELCRWVAKVIVPFLVALKNPKQLTAAQPTSFSLLSLFSDRNQVSIDISRKVVSYLNDHKDLSNLACVNTHAFFMTKQMFFNNAPRMIVHQISSGNCWHVAEMLVSKFKNGFYQGQRAIDIILEINNPEKFREFLHLIFNKNGALSTALRESGRTSELSEALSQEQYLNEMITLHECIDGHILTQMLIWSRKIDYFKVLIELAPSLINHDIPQFMGLFGNQPAGPPKLGLVFAYVCKDGTPEMFDVLLSTNKFSKTFVLNSVISSTGNRRIHGRTLSGNARFHNNGDMVKKLEEMQEEVDLDFVAAQS